MTQRAKELQPDRPEIRLALGDIYLAWERFPEAVREYQELLEKNPDMESVRPQLAKALRAAGRREEANQVYLEPVEELGFAKQE